MNIFIAIYVVLGLFTAGRKPLSTTSLTLDIAVFLAWPFVIGHEAYRYGFSKDREMIKRLRARLNKEIDKRDGLMEAFGRLKRVEIDGKHYISAQSVMTVASMRSKPPEGEIV